MHGITNADRMAYVGARPWHGLGKRLPEGASIEVWREAAGFDWEVLESPVRWEVYDKEGHFLGLSSTEERRVLYRSDTNAFLSTVSPRYQVVQPEDVMEFFRQASETAGVKLETAGTLYGGRRFWALGRSPDFVSDLGGDDTMNAYLLLATSVDGSLSTQAMWTAIRVVCNNTLSLAVLSSNTNRVVCMHSTTFDKSLALKDLGLSKDVWEEGMENILLLKSTPLAIESQERAVVAGLLGDDIAIEWPKLEPQKRPMRRTVEAIMEGAELGDTAWDVLNRVTAWWDHKNPASRSPDAALYSAFFGRGKRVKERTTEVLFEMAREGW